MNKNLIALALFPLVAVAADFEPNYDESKVGTYALPSATDTQQTLTKDYWEQTGRDTILSLFKTHVYGQSFKFDQITVIQSSPKHPLTDIKGYWQTVELMLDQQKVQLLIVMPETSQAVPVFLGYNFCGNHSVIQDASIAISKSWANPQVCGHKVDPTALTTLNNEFTVASRGIRAYRWPIHDILSRGYGVVTAYYGDILPDNPDAFAAFIKSYKLKQSEAEYSAIGIWAGGLSAIIDFLETQKHIDSKKIIAFGHSRLGKTALWAGATDKRFSYVISNNSGEGSAALARRNYGETLGSISKDFPHWFTRQYANYGDKVDQLPVDQHLLISLIAPRPVYVASAEGDQWADPKGEFLAVHYAKPVYALYTSDLFKEAEQPATEVPLHSRVNYHYRKGPHDVFSYDWQQYLTVADRYFNASK